MAVVNVGHGTHRKRREARSLLVPDYVIKHASLNL